jgi:hypothetical protein
LKFITFAGSQFGNHVGSELVHTQKLGIGGMFPGFVEDVRSAETESCLRQAHQQSA